MTPRCIATPTRNTRCTREAWTRDETYACPEHARLVTRAMLDAYLSASTRRMLAHADWETYDQGQALVDEYTRRAA